MKGDASCDSDMFLRDEPYPFVVDVPTHEDWGEPPLRVKVLVLGAMLLGVGALLFVFPAMVTQFGSDMGLLPAPEHPATYFVHVAPSNFSYVSFGVGQNEELDVKVGSGQQTVDFFLMNEDNFSSWLQGGRSVGQVLPQSALDVKNYSFVLTGAGGSQNYSFVFVSRSASAPTDVLLQIFRVDRSPNLTLTVMPIALAGLGVVLLLFGRGGGGSEKAAEAASEEAPRPTTGLGGWQELLNFGSPKCKYCGADLGEATGFCPSCRRSLG